MDKNINDKDNKDKNYPAPFSMRFTDHHIIYLDNAMLNGVFLHPLELIETL